MPFCVLCRSHISPALDLLVNIKEQELADTSFCNIWNPGLLRDCRGPFHPERGHGSIPPCSSRPPAFAAPPTPSKAQCFRVTAPPGSFSDAPMVIDSLEGIVGHCGILYLQNFRGSRFRGCCFLHGYSNQVSSEVQPPAQRSYRCSRASRATCDACECLPRFPPSLSRIVDDDE